MAEFRMPALGADMDEGTLLQWLVQPGDAVKRGQIICVIDTAKTAMDVEVFEDGVVERLLVPPGTTVAVGTPLAVIGAGAAEVVAVPAVGPAAPLVPVESPIVRHLAHQRGLDLAAVAGTGPGGVVTRHDLDAVTSRPRVSPYARRRAAELGIDVATLAGSGPGGAVTATDVEAAAPHPPEVSAESRDLRAEERLTRPEQADRSAAMRRAIGALMSRSAREIPHYYLSTQIDLAAAVAWLEERNVSRTAADRLVPAALLLKAAAVATHAVPEVNGFWVEDAFVPGDGVHLGVAVSLRRGGLVAPAIRDADTLDLDTLMQQLRDLVTRARAGRLRQAEMAAPTLTVTNLGDQGVEAVFGVIYAPQVALVGFGRVVDRPWAVGGLLGVRPVVTATLAADHRVSDGHRGGRYLAAIADLLQRPEEL